MPAERFYVNADLEGTVHLEGVEHHHLAHVMRIRVGEEIELVNGKGSFAIVKVESISKHGSTLRVLSSKTTPPSPPRLKLAIPLMRPAKLELVIEKCTELGADGFFLYRAHFSEKEDLSEHQMERLKVIAISAMKQCGRLFLPNIELIQFEKILAMDGTFLFGDPKATSRPERIEGEIIFVTGPEKGFFAKELQGLEKKGKGITLSKNVLRAETAPIVATVLFS